jgi:3-hydroxyisobutyrate dehydrogenase
MTKPVIGFIGLGQMGLLVVQDTDVSRVEGLVKAHGGKVTAAEDRVSWARVDIIIMMLPNSAIVEEVLLANGVAQALKRGALVIDMSSSEPIRTRKLGDRLQAEGLRFIDAPVSGGVERAAQGKLAIMVGGDAGYLEQAHPVLYAMGTTIIHVGPIGAAHAAKALNNFVSATGLVAVVEALLTAERFGIDPAVMTDVLNSSSGKNNATENKVKQFILSGTFGSGFALKLMAKDLRIAVGLADELGGHADLAHACLDIWEKAAEKSDASTDHTAMYRLLKTH